MKKIKTIQVTQLDPTTLEMWLIPMDEAILKLKGCWKESEIESMLVTGSILCTSYFDYFIAVEQ